MLLGAIEMLNTTIQFNVADIPGSHSYPYADPSIRHSLPSPPILNFLC